MKILFPILFAFITWFALYKFFFSDAEDFWETARDNTFLFALWMLFDTPLGGIRFLLFVGAGILGGILLYRFL